MGHHLPNPEDREGVDRFFEETQQRLGEGLLKRAFSITRDWHMAEDVVQEAWTRLHAALGGKNGEIRDLPSWLSRTVFHVSVDQIRLSERRRRAHTGAADLSWSANEEKISEEWLEQLSLALARLPKQQGLVVYLRHMLHYSFDEIAWRIDANPATVRSNYRHGMVQLRHKLKCE